MDKDLIFSINSVNFFFYGQIQLIFQELERPTKFMLHPVLKVIFWWIYGFCLA